MTQDIDVGKLTEQINDKADRDLWNTVPNVWNNTLNTSQITNCITKIPQDIKLELNNGTLTLKAGSKVYVPNGKNADGTTPKFDEVTIAQDISYPTLSHATIAERVVFLNPNKNSVTGLAKVDTSSGTTQPSSPRVSHTWYDTVNNLVKRSDDTGTTWTSGYSLPICIGNYIKGSGFTSIDQVFNGFGYIGSHWYELKGNEGKARNGRNTDGSLNNSTRTTTNVIVHACGTGTSEWFMMSDFDGNFRNAAKYAYFVQDEMPSISSSNSNYYVWESPRENIIRFTSNKGKTWTKVLQVNCGSYSTVDGRITSFTPKTAFHAVDRNDSSWLSGLGMPSNRYIDLTLGASGSKYTAPANGYVALSASWTNENSYFDIDNLQYIICHNQTGYNGYTKGSGYIPVKRGQIFTVYYQNIELKWFMFIYAEGDK